MAGQSIGSNIKPWSLGKTEIAYSMEKNRQTYGRTEDPEWKLYVPKIMPLITKGDPKETTFSLRSSIFVNEASCKPVIQTSVKVRNYIKASRPANCSFKYPRKPYDMQVEVEVLHNNPDNLRITNTIDNSVP